MPLSSRGARRDQTFWTGRRRLDLHAFLHHLRRDPDCWFCQCSPWRYANAKLRACNCSRHPRGRPKIGTGACYSREVRGAVKERREGRRICFLWRVGHSKVDKERSDILI